MRPKNPTLSGLWQALDEATFGTDRTLNLRESLPSAAEARARADVWLRARQVTGGRQDVLVITGRGNQSAHGIGVIRQEILALLPSLRRRGVVSGWREHTPGSLVIALAPITALLDAPKRRRPEPVEGSNVAIPASLAALEATTLRLLQDLAIQNLEMLGVVAGGSFVAQEMERTFSALASSLPSGPDREQLLRDAILRALDEAD
ncbi:MAG: hypothetical protein ABIR58_02475 [Gemmatimonadaceae bacterium]